MSEFKITEEMYNNLVAYVVALDQAFYKLRLDNEGIIEVPDQKEILRLKDNFLDMQRDAKAKASSDLEP